MKKYRLKKDLPTFKAGEEFYISDYGSLVKIDKYVDGNPYGKICAYSPPNLVKYPNILTDWFEEITEEPKTVWDLEEGDLAYVIRTIARDISIIEVCWNDTWVVDRTIGNTFLTREEAEKELARRKARQILLRDTKGFKPDWENTSVYDNNLVYMVYYDHRQNILLVNAYAINHFPCDIWFATKADAEASIKVHKKEWKVYLGVED